MIKKYKILIICGNLIKHKYFAIKLLKNFQNSNVIFENYPKNISNNYTLHKSKILTNHFKKVQFSQIEINSSPRRISISINQIEKEIPQNTANPSSEKCDRKLIVCQGDTITGKQLSSLSNITNRINQLLKESNQENLIENIVNSMDQFDRTQANLDELIFLSKQEVLRVEPLIKDISVAVAHLTNILSSLDEEETLDDIKLTLSAAKSISGKLDNMSDDVEQIMKDKELTKSIRDLTIGHSKFLNEIYP